MRLTPEQQDEVATQRSETCPTLRATVPALEKILCEPLPVLDTVLSALSITWVTTLLSFRRRESPMAAGPERSARTGDEFPDAPTVLTRLERQLLSLPASDPMVRMARERLSRPAAVDQLG